MKLKSLSLQDKVKRTKTRLYATEDMPSTLVPLYSQEDFKKQFRMQIAEGNQRAWETVECQALLLRVLVSQQCQALLLLQQEPCQDQQLYKERYILAKKKCPTL
ncbi:hypothetical protein GWK47_046806 [Chionoecetes opilio]|uniref:Uncharacterized protein n=1 Tax=Chionoecetes opilio TaxID=41210 RepID=A0A8J4Y5V9_CHIOP|nr:hypothetical protein GWK47_046806 [Chionoecetes opilio]